MPESKAAPKRSAPTRRRVLLAEDDAVSRQLAQRLLESRGWQVTAVADGAAALAQFERRPFDLVLLDVEMPKLDGPSLATRIRACQGSDGQRRVPLVALTAHRRPEEHERCRRAGIDACLDKPLDPAALDRILAGAAPEAAATDGGPAEAPVDWQLALEHVNGNRGLLARLAATAGGETERRLAELRAGLDAEDTNGVRLTAHGLRGSLRLFGAATARRIARRIEELAAEERLQQAATLVEDLEAALRPVREQLAEGPPAPPVEEEV